MGGPFSFNGGFEPKLTIAAPYTNGGFRGRLLLEDKGSIVLLRSLFDRGNFGCEVLASPKTRECTDMANKT
ncbi:MAG: hypothetical protein ACI9TA_001389, partial [Reinekea sp.]